MNAKLAECLKQLRLSGLAASLDVRLQEATANQLNHAECLELVLQDELAVRQNAFHCRQRGSLHRDRTCEFDDEARLAHVKISRFENFLFFEGKA